MEYNIDNAELTATLTAVNLDAAVIGQAPLEVAIGESARIDVGEAINYIKTGTAEINQYVNNVSKPEIDIYVEDTAEPLVAQIIEEQAEPVINAYVDNEVIPNINSVADSTLTAFNNNASAKTTAFNDNASAKTTAFDNNAASAIATIEPLVTTATSAATAASTSATNAATSASNASSSASDALSAKNAAVAAKDAAESAATDANVVAVGTDLRASPSKIKTVANNITDVNTVANSISNVNSVAGNISNVNAVAGNATNINAVNTNKNNINTVAGISSDVTTVAGIASDITTVVGSTAIISTVANNIANVNNVGNDILKVNAVADDLRNINAVYNSLIDIGAVASRIVDVTDVAAISSDVSTVAGIALDITDVVAISSDISTVASNAANVRTVANNDTNISTVATNISDVNTVATNTSNIATVVANITDIQNAASNAAKARDWAVKMDGKIDGDDYSAKYYAAKAEEAAASIGDPANRDLSNLTATGEAKFTAKQDTISDLATIRSGAALGATSVQPSDLATVATSGSYNDLSNKPTIPTVNNPTITFTQGGTTKGTFTLNQASNETIALDAGGSAPTNMVTTNTAQDITSVKTFIGEKRIKFKQSQPTSKLGFTLYTTSDAELGALELRPNTINGNPILTLNSSSISTTYVGFRYWSSGVNILAPQPATSGNYFITIGVTDGTNTIYNQTDTGVIDISTLLAPYALSANLATVATSGAYSDLSGTPNMADYVTLATDQTVTGNKTTSGDFMVSHSPVNDTGNLIYKNTDISARGATISSDLLHGIRFSANNGNSLSDFADYRYANGDSETLIRNYNNDNNGTAHSGKISIVWSKSAQNFYTYAPASDESNSIVTTINKTKSGYGYYELGNGLILQWGNVAQNSNTTGTITFPKPFVNGYKCVAVGNSSSTFVWLTGDTNTSITWNKTSASSQIKWIAIGC